MTEKMKDATHYIGQAGMCASPEFYSARGPKPGDLGNKELVKFLELMKKDGGDKAAEAFVAMVAGIKSAAATTFLLGFYELAGQGWEWNGAPEHINREYDFAHSTHDEDRIRANAMATIMAAFGRSLDGANPASDAANDYACRGAFLEKNGYTLDGKAWRKLMKGEKPGRRMNNEYRI